MSQGLRCLLYTPVYETSYGTQYRINMMINSLKYFGINTLLLVDRYERFFKRFYNLFSPNLLMKRHVWERIGSRIANRIRKLGVDKAILFTDVTSGAARHLRRYGINTIVSLEDLTAFYHPRIRLYPDRFDRFMDILCGELYFADYIITPSYTLSEYLRKHYNLDIEVIPIGLKIYSSLDYALNRKFSYALHVNQIDDIRQALSINRLAGKLKENNISFLVLEKGKYTYLVKDVEWYSYGSYLEAVKHIMKAFMGVITEFGHAFTLSSIYFHLSLLQPIMAIGCGPWIEEADKLGVELISSIDDIDDRVIRNQYENAKRLEIPDVHRKLVSLL